MQYSNENAPDVEKAIEWMIGPAVVFIVAALVCAVLLSNATGF